VASNTLSPYGAFELKRSYQRNMFISFVAGAAIYVILMWVFLWFTSKPKEVPQARTIVVKSITDLAPPPQLTKLPPQTAYQVPKVKPPSVGIPEAVPDEEAPENVNVASQEELKVMSAPPVDSVEKAPVENIVIENVEDLLPSPDEFVPVEQQPQIVKAVKPEYPELAKRMGLTGKVWIKVLVDKNGKVRDAIVAKASGVDAGFEEAAIKAAKQYIYTPAIANGKPVAVWVLYPVNFTLEQ